MNRYLLDTSALNAIDNETLLAINGSIHQYFVTHIQKDELGKTKDDLRRSALFALYKKVRKISIATDSLVLGVSRLDQAKLGQSDLYNQIKNELDKFKRKKNNIEDALIAETAIINDLILVSNDKNLLIVTRNFGGTAITFIELLRSIKGRPL